MVVKNISEIDYTSITDFLETEGIIIFEDTDTSFSSFKKAFDAYQKEIFKNELKYLSGSTSKNRKKPLHFYRNPERLSKTYALRLINSLP